MALGLQVWQAASSVERSLVGGVGRLSRLDAGDVEATASRGSDGLLGELAQSAQGSGTRSDHGEGGVESRELPR